MSAALVVATDPDGMMVDVTVPTGPIVGRAAELGTLQAALAAARTGAGAGIIIGGDAGVGKTRLVRELIAAAHAAGDLVLLGHCVHFGGESLPYLPLREALVRLQRHEPDTVATLVGRYPTLERLLPESGGPEATQNQRRLEGAEILEAVAGALLDLAGSRPVLLVIEDVHWADDSTRDLIGFLLTRLTGTHVTVLVSVRTDDLHRRHPLRPALADWGRLPDVVRVNLGPLSPDALRELVEAQRSTPLSEPDLERILERSAGNPFFAEQLASEVDTSDAVPAGLADLLLVQLERLSPQAHSVVRTAAVAGRRVSHPELQAVAELDDVTLEAALREAVEAHVMVSVDRQSYEFRHALLAEAVYDDLLPGERARLHTGYARELSAAANPALDADLAWHARQAFDLPTAFAAFERAASSALHLGANAEALRLYQSALELTPQVPGADIVAITLVTAEAAELAGYQMTATRLAEELLARSDLLLTSEERAELLMALAHYRLPFDLPGDPSEHSAQALALLGEEATPLRARALTVHAHARQAMGEDREAVAVATEALNLARALGLPRVAADASTTLARASGRLGDPDSGLTLLAEAAAEAARIGDNAGQVRALHGLGALQHERGDLVGALHTYTEAMTRAEQEGRRWSVYGLASRCLVVLVLYELGRWDEALAVARVEGQSPTSSAEENLLGMALPVLVGRGDTNLAAVEERVAPWQDRDGVLRLNIGVSQIERFARAGDVTAALAAHDRLVSELAVQWQQTWFNARIRLHTLALAVVAGTPDAMARGDRLIADLRRTGRAIAADEPNEGRAGGDVAPVMGPEGQAWAARGEAEWARLRWLADDHAPSAEELVAAWRTTVAKFDYGHAFEQARSRARLAEVLAMTGDAVHAAEERAASETVARALGAAPLLAQLAALGRPTSGGAAMELTARERQVLALLAEGQSNRQIGRRLYISDKTVSVHVSNILGKLGAAGRTEAAAIARRDGLLDDPPPA